MELRQVVFHSPGPNWKTGVGFREQPGIMEHVQHYAGFHENGKLLYGGPFTDADSGGMMVASDSVMREEIEEFPASDSAIIAGLLKFRSEGLVCCDEEAVSTGKRRATPSAVRYSTPRMPSTPSARN